MYNDEERMRNSAKVSLMSVELLADSIGLEWDEEKALKLYKYRDLLLEKNKEINLTAITDREDFVNDHYMDSLLLAEHPEIKEAKTIADVGTGGGFPGIPLAVAFPEKEFLLMDSSNKRLEVIEELCETIGITNVKTLHARAEDAGKGELRESFDLAVSRAVANMSVLSELCLPLVKVGGNFVAYKSMAAMDEIEDAKTAITTMGGNLGRTVLPPRCCDASHLTSHCLVFINKESPTPEKYPRKAGIPEKRPITNPSDACWANNMVRV